MTTTVTLATSESLTQYIAAGGDPRSVINQHILSRLVDREVLHCVSSMVSHLEYWAVTKWFSNKLSDHGEITGELFDFDIWGRCCSGQSISMDYVVAQIAAGMQILEGQVNSWADKDDRRQWTGEELEAMDTGTTVTNHHGRRFIKVDSTSYDIRDTAFCDLLTGQVVHFSHVYCD